MKKRLIMYSRKHKFFRENIGWIAGVVYVVGMPVVITLSLIPVVAFIFLDWGTAVAISIIPNTVLTFCSILWWCGLCFNWSEQIGDPFTEYVECPVDTVAGWSGDCW